MILSARDLTLPGRLRDVSARLEPGTVTAICGPNGAGKSTLLQCLGGLLQPAAGEVRLDDKSLADLHPKERARCLGYLPQSADIAWNLSVEALAGLGRLPYGDKGEAQVAQALAAVDMSRFAARSVTTLSGGEKARALLARVLAGEPRWILADEPLAALDLAHQLALLKHLKTQAEAGAGVVLVLHDLALAMNHAHRVLVLSDGELAADGMPEAALSEAVIDRVWQVRARWLGKPGARALAT